MGARSGAGGTMGARSGAGGTMGARGGRPVGIVPTAPIVRGTVSVGVWAMNDETTPRGGSAGGRLSLWISSPYRGRHPGACSRSLAAYASGSSSHNRGPTCRRTHISVPDVQVDAAMAAQDPEYRDRKVHR